MRRVGLVLWTIAGCLMFCSRSVAGGDPATEWAARRALALGRMDTSSAMVLRSPEVRMRNADVNYRFRQESNLLYLTGLNRPSVTLVLAPAGVMLHDTVAHVLLFARAGEDGEDPLPAIGDGVILDPGRFQEIMSGLAGRLSMLYVNQAGVAFMQDWLSGKPMFLERDSRREFEQRHPGLKVKNAGPVLAVLRQMKSGGEVGEIRKAIAATDTGLRRAMQRCRPGTNEYELQAEIEYGMATAGAQAQSFPSIIGSGPNALILHYELNRRATRAGEVVVMDVGAEVNGYAADITRTIPVSGNFTAAQRKVYETVLRAQQAVIATARPGALWKSLDATARSVITGAGFGAFWQHSVSHHLGLDVHDAGVMDTLRAGMVITAEPGIYIPVNDTTVTAEYRGIGVRIEDDVLITPEGSEVLSAHVPKTVAEIEQLMKTKR